MAAPQPAIPCPGSGRRGKMTPLSRYGVLFGLAGSLLCGGSATWAQTYPAPGYATEAYTPRGFRLPAGGGCAGDIARWNAIQANDYASGNVGLGVYRAIQGEIAQATASCAAGHDAQARALVKASKRKHGYPG